MFTWIAENAATVIAAAVLLVVIGLAVFSLVRDKKKKTISATRQDERLITCLLVSNHWQLANPQLKRDGRALISIPVLNQACGNACGTLFQKAAIRARLPFLYLDNNNTLFIPIVALIS